MQLLEQQFSQLSKSSLKADPISWIMSDVVADLPCRWNAWLLHCLVRAQAPNAATADGFTLQLYKTRQNYLTGFILYKSATFSVSLLYIIHRTYYSPSYCSSCGGRMGPVSQSSQRSRQKVPLSTTSSPAAFSAARHHCKHTITPDQRQWWALKAILVSSLVRNKPLLPSEIRSCSPFSTRVMLPIATLSCMTLRLWLELFMGSWCWDSQTEKMLLWTHKTTSDICLVWGTHQWLVESGELH